MTDHLQPTAHDADDDADLLAVAMAIGDGSPVDWDRVPATSGAGPASVTARLRALEHLIRSHDDLRESTGPAKQEATLLTEARRADPDALDVTWGSLLVREKLGHGSYGDVYRAWDPRLQRDVALKVLARSNDDHAVVDEARRMARVTHPHVLSVFGADVIDGRTGIWMQLVRGRSLHDEVRARGPLPSDEVRRIGIQLAGALETVHEAGLLHRDVKAQNVMRDASGNVLLGDFGASVEHQATASDGYSVTAGTPLYLAPELLEGAPASSASDYYALGVLLYFLATGEYPVAGDSTRAIRDAHRRRASVPLAMRRPELPASLSRTIDALLQPTPETRLTGRGEVAAALSDAAAPRRSVTTGLLMGMLAAATLGLLGWLVRGESSAPVTGDRAVLDPPCVGAMSASGWIACGAGAGPIRVFNPASGDRIDVTPAPGGVVDGALVSPDGRQVLYSVRLDRADGTPYSPDVVRRYDLDSHTDDVAAEVPEGMTLAALRGWVPGRNAVVVYAERDGAFRLLQLDLNDRAWSDLVPLPGSAQGHDLSPDGQLVAYDIIADDGRRDVVVCRMKGPCLPVSPHPADDFQPFWGPDNSLFFSSSRNGTLAVWRARVADVDDVSDLELVQDLGRRRLSPLGFDAAGTLAYELRDFGDVVTTAGPVAPLIRVSADRLSTNTAPAWSPTGRLAWLTQHGPFAGDGPLAVVVRELDGTTRELPVDLARFNSARLAWSPSERKLAVYGLHQEPSDAGTSRPGIQVIDTETGRPLGEFTPRSSSGGIGWLDDETVAFSLSSGVGAYDFDAQEERVVWPSFSPSERVLDLAMSPDRDRMAVTIQARDRSRTRVLIVPVAGGEPTTLHAVSGTGLSAQDWLPDGRAVLVTISAEDEETASLVALPLDGSSARPVRDGIDRLAWARVAPDGHLALAINPVPPVLWLSDRFR